MFVIKRVYNFFSCYPRALKRKLSVINPKKLYVIDTGCSLVLGNEFSISRAMENTVFLELLRRGYRDIFYWRGEKEVDFVISNNFKPTALIQVTYTTDKLNEREIEGIIETKEQLKTDENLIITWDYEEEIEGIKAIPLWKWLLK